VPITSEVAGLTVSKVSTCLACPCAHTVPIVLASLCSRYPSIPVDLLRPLARRHGTLASTVLGDARTLDDLGESFGGGLTAREVDYLVEHEWAREPDDVLWRRTKCGLPMSASQRTRVGAYVRSRTGR